MGRTPRFTREAIAGAALRLVAERGPQAVTVADLASALGAPTGSIYHRYPSRERLLAELWMDVVERFQAAFLAQLAGAEDADGAARAARVMVTWTREHMTEARLLLLYRRQDFVAGEWPADLVDRAAALEPAMGAGLRGFARRAGWTASADTVARLRYGLLDAPFGAVKPYVQQGKPPPPVVDELIELTVRAVLGPQSRRRT